VGYYTKDDTPPPFAPVTWLPENSTMNYLVRSPDGGCSKGIKVTVYMTHEKKSPGGQALDVMVGVFLPAQQVHSAPADGTRKDFTGVSTTFPPPPAGAALSSGLITVRLRVPEVTDPIIILSLDVLCAE
jgi:hypothetical protein